MLKHDRKPRIPPYMPSPDNQQRPQSDNRPTPRADSQQQATPAAPPSQVPGGSGGSGRPEPRIQVSELSLPKGGGAIQGMGETFQANEFSGTSGMSIPVATSPCRDFAPSLSVDYSSGSGNGPWGMGFSASIPQITRQTRHGTPKYTDQDVFVLSGAADLVPVDGGTRTEKLPDVSPNVCKAAQDRDGKKHKEIAYTIQTFRPRQEGLFALIEYWQPNDGPQGDAFWKVTTKDHVVSIYGKTVQAKIADPNDENRVFTWLLEESYNAKGDHQLFCYKQENTKNVPNTPYEKNHVQTAQRYIERIRYGNQNSVADSLLLGSTTDPGVWHFEVVFDYGEYNVDLSNKTPYTPVRTWASRPDPFSTYHAGFEIRTHRRCLHTLMFHRFGELGSNPVLVHATNYTYGLNYAQMSEMASVSSTGYTYDKEKQAYTTASLPPLELKYTPFSPEGHAFVPLTDEQGDALSGLNDAPAYSLVDLFGEGIPGIFYSDGAATYYRDPMPETTTGGGDTHAPQPLASVATSPDTAAALHYGPWQPLTTFPVQRQTQGVPGVALQDVTGNGQLDLVMEEGAGLQGFWEAQPDRQWKPFHSFTSWPTEFPAPAQTWTDMTGDGIADLVQLTAQQVRVYPSAREQGLGPPLGNAPAHDLPPTLTDLPDQTVRFADMAGSGQSHVVRIRNGEVVYWPNLSYGRFGDPITMENAPYWGPNFDTARLFLADLDGSGTSDLIYLQDHQAIICFNQSGNKFSAPIQIPLPMAFTQLEQVSFADVYGRGNACLILSAPQVAPVPKHWCYDFCQGNKPYILYETDNNMGAKTTIAYKSSVDYYLADKKAGLPWITNLPFPVQVVAEVTHTDAISGSRYTSQYSYHHGYYDGVEREFRGFGRVDRQDTEYFPPSKVDYSKNPEYVAPALSRTWYHTGAFLKKAELSRQYEKEYYQGDKDALAFPDSTIDWAGITPEGETQRQAYVAMAGMVLRSELYGLDNSPQASVPYTVSESNFRVLLKQAKGTHPYAVFFVHPEQSLTYDYERNADDPQIHQSFVLQVDEYGHTQRSCSIAYPRRKVPTVTDPVMQKALQAGQGALKATAALSTYYNEAKDPTKYLLGVPIEVQGCDVSEALQKVYQTGKALTVDEADTQVPSVDPSSSGTPKPLAPLPQDIPLLSWERLYYAPVASLGATKKLPLGQVTLPLLLTEHHVAEYSEAQITAALADTPLKGTDLDNKLKAGYYQKDTKNNYWWNSGLTEHYSDATQFYLPKATADPVGNQTTYTYDPHHLLLTEIKDALENRIKATAIDYAHLHPMTMLDANNNTSEVKLDSLGRVVHTSHYGTNAGQVSHCYTKDGKIIDCDAKHDRMSHKGFKPLSEASTETPKNLDKLLEDPGKYLGGAQSFYYYDPFAWKDRKEPVFGVALAAEDYPPNGSPASYKPDAATIQIGIHYSDGFGRTLCSKARVEDGNAFITPILAKEGPGEVQLLSQGNTNNRWLTSGRVVYNNKGDAVKQYEPYYIDTPAFVSDPVLDTFGVSDTLYYDPLSRVTQVLTTKGFYEKHAWAAWEETLSDANDTLKDSPYYQVNIVQPDTQSPFYDQHLTEEGKKNLAYVAQYFHDTPQRTMVNNLGHTIIEEHILHKPNDDKDPNQVDRAILYTYHTYDIQGHLLTSTDPRLSQTPGLHNFQMTYSLAGEVLKTVSADAGTRWALTNTLGNLIWSYDSRQVTITPSYDVLHRPTQVRVRKPATDKDPLKLDNIVERMIYGDTLAHKKLKSQSYICQHNLRGQLYQHYDQAGLVTMPDYSLAGTPLETQRRFRKEYKKEAGWDSINAPIVAALLQDKVYTERTMHDALGRTTKDLDADENVVVPTYHPHSGRLNKIMLMPKDDPAHPIGVVKNITYNARSQREQINYGNNTTTKYAYDPKTFETTGIQTTNNDSKKLQDLTYVYDPVGNVVSKTDAAQDVVFYNNAAVPPTMTYIYDSLYRLIEGSGREKVHGKDYRGGEAAPKIPIVPPNPHTNDNSAVQTYVEKYTYDTANNLTRTRHIATNNAWTRDMVVAPTSNRAVMSDINGWDTPKIRPGEVDRYFDKHGNQTMVQTVRWMGWDYRDNLSHAMMFRREQDKNDAEYYIYDSSGQRVRKVREVYGPALKTVNIKETLYLGALEIRTTRQGANPQATTPQKEYHSVRVTDGHQSIMTRDRRVVGTPPPCLQEPILRYHLTDHLDSCTVEVNDQGGQISREEYSPFGASTLFIGIGSAKELKHYRYSGQERDSYTGFYYYGARYYAPWLTRWLSPDPAGTIDGLNIYAFVRNNPVTHRDVGGMAEQETTDIQKQQLDILMTYAQKTKPIIARGKPRQEINQGEHREIIKKAYQQGKNSKGGHITLFRVNDKHKGIPTKERQNYTVKGPQWTPLASTAFVLGAIHAGKNIYIETPPTRENLTGGKGSPNAILAREIATALSFGYKPRLPQSTERYEKSGTAKQDGDTHDGPATVLTPTTTPAYGEYSLTKYEGTIPHAWSHTDEVGPRDLPAELAPIFDAHIQNRNATNIGAVDGPFALDRLYDEPGSEQGRQNDYFTVEAICRDDNAHQHLTQAGTSQNRRLIERTPAERQKRSRS